MQQKIQLIALRTVRHSDRTSILTAFTRELGSMAFAVPAGAGPGAARRRALLMPMSPVEVVASVRPGRELATFREPRPLLPLHGVHADPARVSLCLFLAEALAAILRQSEGDPAAFDFIFDAIRRLNDPQTPVANFHLAFLRGLAVILGIAPDASAFRPGMIFDMADGRFRASAPLHGQCLSPADSQAAARLMRISWTNMHRFRYSRAQRAAVLDAILAYYSLHHANLSALRSPDVLRTL